MYDIMRTETAGRAARCFAILAVVACAQRPMLDPASARMSRGATLSTTPDSATQHAILRARDAVWRAWFANDTAQLHLLLPESVTAGRDDGPGQGWANRAQTLAEAAQFASAGGELSKLEFPSTEIRLMGDVAVVYSTYDVETTMHRSQHSLRGHSTEIFVLRGGRWVNPFWHLGA